MNPILNPYIDQLTVRSGKNFKLKDFATDVHLKPMDKAEGVSLLNEGIEKLAGMQDMLYAGGKHSVLIVLQAMDAAGKDGLIKHVMKGLNPQGVKVYSFKTPSSEELSHDYFWRHYKVLPAKGEIVIFNRSHYENVLITKVHPEFILNEKLPHVKDISDIDNAFWTERYKQIRRIEKNIAKKGTLILKFFLHLSKEEQKERFLKRIEDPAKQWKFSMADIEERKYWEKYQTAYEGAIRYTSEKHAPWFVIPADDKWFARLAVASIIYNEVSRLDLCYPTLSEEDISKLKAVKDELMDL